MANSKGFLVLLLFKKEKYAGFWQLVCPFLLACVNAYRVFYRCIFDQPIYVTHPTKTDGLHFNFRIADRFDWMRQMCWRSLQSWCKLSMVEPSAR